MRTPLANTLMRRGPTRRRRQPQIEVVIRAEQCTACGACVDMCPLDAIDIETSASINADLCGQCGACVTVCPEGAIDWVR